MNIRMKVQEEQSMAPGALSAATTVRMMMAPAAITSSWPHALTSRVVSEILRGSAPLAEAFRETAIWECRACAGG